MQLPPELRQWIEEYARGIPTARLQRAADALSAHYRERRATTGIALPSDEKVAAYLVTRLPATWAACRIVLTELRMRLGERDVTSILDLGAGAGAASLAARGVFPPLEEFSLVEPDADFTRVAAKLIPGATIIAQDLRRCSEFAPHDLVIASYCLGELPEASRANVLRAAWQSARMALVVVEPRSPAGFAVVKAARKTLLASGARMAAPCPAEGDCPMAAADWCHFAARVERTPLHRRLKHAELSYEDEKFSYVAVAQEEVVRAPARIIRRPEHQPGLIQLVTCCGDEVRAERATRRHADQFRAARKAEWGGEWK